MPERSSPLVEHRPFPRGDRGARLSIREVAERAAKGRLDPRVRAWAVKQLMVAMSGDARAVSKLGEIDRAKILFEALRKQVPWVPDPKDAEMMVGAACTLVGCEGLHISGGDCDDLCIAYLSACGSVDVSGAAVGHSYSTDQAIGHVLTAVHDGRDTWYYADPSTDLPFGKSYKPTWELWIGVPSAETMCDASYCDPKAVTADVIGDHRKDGDFVGVGQFLFRKVWPMETGVGAEPMVAESAVSEAILKAWQAALERLAYDSMGSAWNGLRGSYVELREVREAIGKPLIDPTGTTGPAWTASDEGRIRGVERAVEIGTGYADQAIAAERGLAWSTTQNDLVLLGGENEPRIEQAPDGTVFVVEGTKKTSLGVGIAPIVIIGIAAAVIVFTGLAYLSISKICDVLRDQIDRARIRDINEHVDKLIAQGVPPDKAHDLAAGVVKAAADARATELGARREESPWPGIVKFLGVAALGGVVAWGGIKVYEQAQARRRVAA